MTVFSEVEALQQLMDTVFAQTAKRISDLLDAFSAPKVPAIRVVSFDEMKLVLNERIRLSSSRLIVSSQHVFGDLTGESLFVIDELSAANLARHLGSSPNRDRSGLQESVMDAVMEMGNLVAAACLRGMGERLNLDLVFSRPAVEVFQMEGIRFDKDEYYWGGEDRVILVHTQLDFHREQIWSTLYLILETASLIRLQNRLEALAGTRTVQEGV